MSEATGEKMKSVLERMGFNPIGSRRTENGDIYVGEREAWIGREISRKGMEVIYFIVSGDMTHGVPATYDPGDGAVPSREERLSEAFRHAEVYLNG